MASVSYPVSNITAGVSTQEYSLRMDGQASAQSNALNSPRYGLCKRPNSHYLARLETNAPFAAPVMFPLVYGGAEKLYISNGSVTPRVFSTTGTSETVCLFPSSSTVGSSAYSTYAISGEESYPNSIKYVRVGDVTFVANTNVPPAMKATTWTGYTNSSTSITQGDGVGTLSAGAVKNSDVWAAFIKRIEPNIRAEYTISWSEDIAGTVTEYSTSIFRARDKKPDDAWYQNFESGGLDSFDGLHEGSAANGLHLSGKLAYHVTAKQNGNSHNMMQVTSLSNMSYASGTADITTTLREGTTSILGRYINQESSTPGSLTSVSSACSVASRNPAKDYKAGAQLDDHIGMAWQTVPSVAELPPISWTDHTLKVTNNEEDPFGFYMRFVSDAVSPTSYSHTKDSSNPYPVFDATTSISKTGHWEEHCAVGITTDVDTTTMPHMVVRRPDGTFAFMEAQGSFVINSAAAGVTFNATDNYFTVDNFDGGFNDGETASPLVQGDTIEFTVGGTNFPSTLTTDTTYYIKTANYVSGAWRYTLSATPSGSALAFTGGGSAGTCKIKLTTYKDLTFTSRAAGDDDTNPLPDFFKNPIQGLSSYQDRLVIYTENEVALSGTADQFNFFRSTVRDLLESDRILINPSQADNESIRQLVPYKTGLIAVTNRKQLMIYGQNGAFGPSTVTVIEASAAATDINTTPLVVEDSLYLAYSTQNGGGMYELYPESQTGFTARSVSQQVPGYLPEGPRALQASEKHGMLFWLDDGTGTNASVLDQERIYVYTWDVSGPNKQQSAWGKWEFNSNNATTDAVGYKIHNMVCMGDRLYMLTESEGCVLLEYINLDVNTPEADLDTTTKAAFNNILLDRLIPRTSFTSIGIVGGDDTEIVVPYEVPTTDDVNMEDEVVIVATSGSTTTYYTTGITVANGTGQATITLADTDLTGVSVKIWVGFKYTMSHTLGSFSPTIGQRAVRGRNVFVRGGRLTYSKLNTLAIATDATRTQTISAGGTAAKNGEEFFAIHQHLTDLSVTITNDTPWQSMIQGLDYDLNIQEGMNQAVWR